MGRVLEHVEAVEDDAESVEKIERVGDAFEHAFGNLQRNQDV